jgi:hypothetical protein
MVFLGEFFEIGGLAITHKRNELNLAMGQREKYTFFFQNPAMFYNCRKKNPLNVMTLAQYNFPKKSFVP